MNDYILLDHLNCNNTGYVYLRICKYEFIVR